MYRGEDLDLRTPQTWRTNESDLASYYAATSSDEESHTPSRSGPIWVDDVVLACCNHAYDIALAHRAGDVRLEHLIHALTRIDLAAEALEKRGVRVAALRRESATIIASEIPVSLPNGKGSPRRSEDLADLLRKAAAIASRRNEPALVDDLLDVLFYERLASSAHNLLARHMIRRMDDYEPAPRYTTEPHYVSQSFSRPPLLDAVRYNTEHQSTSRDFQAIPQDQIQNSRIEALENMVRALSSDLSKEREVFTGLLERVSRESQAGREDHNRMSSALIDRLKSLEGTLSRIEPGEGAADGANSETHLAEFESIIERRLTETEKKWHELIDRLERIEQSMQALPAGGGDAAALEQLENRLSRSVEDQTGRIESLVATLDGAPGSEAGPLTERVAALVQILETQQQADTNLSNNLSERLAAVENAVTAEIQTSATKYEAYTADLTNVHDAIMKLNQNQHTLAGAIDQWRSDVGQDTALIANRLAALDCGNEQAETLAILSKRMQSMNDMMIERYHRRNRFWYWLFGTDDWIGASWPSQAQAQAIEIEKARIGKLSATSESHESA